MGKLKVWGYDEKGGYWESTVRCDHSEVWVELEKFEYFDDYDWCE